MKDFSKEAGIITFLLIDKHILDKQKLGDGGSITNARGITRTIKRRPVPTEACVS